MPIQLLIVGQIADVETLSLRDWIGRQFAGAASSDYARLDEGLTAIAVSNWIPDLVVVLQNSPDEFSAADIHRLSQHAPLARWVVCFGPWCESDGRTRDLWPLAVRVPRRSARSRLLQEQQVLGNSHEPLPLSASREEIFPFDHSPLGRTDVAATIAVCSPDAAYARYLNELLTSSGHRVTTVPNDFDANIDWILYDVDPPTPARMTELGSLIQRFGAARVLALTALLAPQIDGVTLVPKLGSQQQILDAVAASPHSA